MPSPSRPCRRSARMPTYNDVSHWQASRLESPRTLLVLSYLVAAFFLVADDSSKIMVSALATNSKTNNPQKTYNYFAFGSNMCSQTMTELRKLSPLASTAAVLPRHELRFNIPGLPFVEPSWASVEPVSTDVMMGDEKDDDSNVGVVHGVLYSLTEEDFVSVCNTEGVPFGYTLHRCRPIPYAGNGIDAGAKAISDPQRRKGVAAYTLRAARKEYRQSSKSNDPAPSQSYMNVLLRGAREYQIDAEYVDMLENIPTGRAIFGGTAERMLDASVAANRRQLV